MKVHLTGMKEIGALFKLVLFIIEGFNAIFSTNQGMMVLSYYKMFGRCIWWIFHASYTEVLALLLAGAIPRSAPYNTVFHLLAKRVQPTGL